MAYSATLTIPAGAVASSLTNFVTRVDLAHLSANWWTDTSSDLGNVRVKQAGTVIPFDVVWYDRTAQTGSLFFKASLTTSDNTFAIETVDGATALAVTDPNGRNAVWSGYDVVLAGISATAPVDRTGKATVSIDGTVTSSSSGWLVLSGTGNLRVTGLPKRTAWTMGASVVLTTIPRNAGMLSYSDNSSDNANRASMLAQQSTNGGRYGLWNSSNSYVTDPGTQATADLNNRRRLVHTQDGTTSRVLWRDGVSVATGAPVAQRPASGSDGTMALFVGAEDTSFQERMEGQLNYAYLRNGVLTADWLAAESVSWETPGSFYSITASTTTGAASLTLSASAAAAGAVAGTASLSLSASGTPVAPVSGSASLALDASGLGLGPNNAAGDASLTLTASGTAGAGVAGAASLSVSASGAAGATAAGAASLSLSASGDSGEPPTPYVAAVLADGPIAYWRLGDALDTGFPSTAHDSSGHGHDGTYDAGMGSLLMPGAIAGDPDQGLYFGGSAAGTHDLQIPFWSGLNTSTFTYETWVKLNSFPGDNPLFGRTGNPGPVHVGSDAAGNIVVRVNSGATTASYSSATSAYYYGDGYRWHHVAITRDSGGTLRIYIDGVLDVEFADSLSPDASTSEGFEAGTYGGIGSLDELALYDYALPADRVFAHYLIGHGASGTASLTLSASGTVTGASARGTASLTLSASGQVPTPTTGTATLELSAEGWATAIFATDTTNALDGLDLLLSASVQQFTPVAAAPVGAAERYDVAIPYPVPVMVDGRPT